MEDIIIPQEIKISELFVCKIGRVGDYMNSIKDDIVFKTICYNRRGTNTYIDLNDGSIYRSWDKWIDPKCEKTKLSILSKGNYISHYKEYLDQHKLKSSDTISFQEVKRQVEELVNTPLFEIQKTTNGI